MATASGTQAPKMIAERKSLIVSGKIRLPGKLAALAKAMQEQPDASSSKAPAPFATMRQQRPIGYHGC